MPVDPSKGGSSDKRTVTRREFDEVIRRASELAASETDSGEGALGEAEVMRIAGEVGLPERHVRKALAEVRSGVVVRSDGGAVERMFGPETVRASRVVPGAPRELALKLDSFLVGGQLLQSVRKSDRLLQYRPAVDWASQVARVASATSRSYYVAAARSVEVSLDEMEPGRTLVDIQVDPGTRGEAVGAATAGALVGGATGAGGAVALAIIATAVPVAAVVAGGIAVAAAIGGGSISWAARIHRRKLRDVVAELEGILDRLESGDTLEPPPPAWRQWVKRQFHGVAKDFANMKDR